MRLKSNPAKWVGMVCFLAASWATADSSASPALPGPPGSQLRPTAAPDAGDPTDPDSTFDNIEIVDPNLKGRLTVLRVGSEPSPNNLLTVFAGLKNKTDNTLKLEVQTIYKDSMGNALNSGSWIVLTLKPHEEKEYRSTSISEQFNANAVNAPFLIRVRRAVSTAHG
jgi:hypothetical protein